MHTSNVVREYSLEKRTMQLLFCKQKEEKCDQQFYYD